MKKWALLIVAVSWAAWAADEKAVAPPTKPASTNAPVATRDLPTGRAVIDRYIQVAGGKEAFLRHSSILLKGRTEVAGKELGGAMMLATAKPNKMLLSIELSGIAIKTGFDGKIGWQVNPITGPSIMEGKELKDVERQADFFSILHEDKDMKSMENLGRVQFEGEDCYKLKLVHNDGDEVTEYYSVATGLQKGFTGTQESSLGAITATSVNEEHKKFGELLLPSRVTQKMAGAGLSQTMVVESIEFDKVPDSMFAPPPEIRALLNAPKEEPTPVEKLHPVAPKKSAI